MISKFSNFAGPISSIFSGAKSKLLFYLDSINYNFYNSSFTFDSGDSFGVTFSSNSVTSTIAGWNGNRATSVDRIPLGKPFKLKFKRGETLGDIMCGVSQNPPINNDATYTRSSFGFYLGYGIGGDTGISITEGGNFSINVVTNGSYPASTVYTILFDGIRVRYYINDNLFYTSLSVPTNDLFLYIIFLQSNKSIIDIEFGSMNPVWNDVSGNNKNFNLINSPKYSNNSLSFNKDLSQYAHGDDTGTLSHFTIDTWFNLRSLPEYYTNPQIVTNTFDNSHPHINFTIGFLNGNPIGDAWSNKLGGGFFPNGSILWKYTDGFTPQTNTWYNTTLTYDNKHLSLYLNGSLYSSVTCSVPTTTSGLGIDIGKRWDLSEFIDGEIDIVRIWNGALPPTQILNNYNTVSPRYVFATSSILLNGNSSIEIPCGNEFLLGTTYTIEFWSKSATSSVGHIYTIMSQRDSDSSIDVFYQDGNLIIRNGTVVTPEPTPGVWTHVAIVSNSSSLSVYYNGLSQSVSGNGGNLLNNKYGLSIGCRGPLNNFQYFNGSLYGIRINNTAVYTSNFDPYDVALPPANIDGTVFLLNEYQVSSGNFIDSSYNKLLFNRGVTHSSDIPTRTYQYYKWLINGVAGGPSNMVQVGEFAFLHNGITQSMMGVTISNPPDNGNEPVEGIEKMIDGNLSTKWLNRTGMVTDGFAPVYFDFGTQSLFDSYRWATGNDSDRYPERTPKSWILYGSNDNSTWNILHNVLSFTAGNTPSTWQNIQYFN